MSNDPFGSGHCCGILQGSWYPRLSIVPCGYLVGRSSLVWVCRGLRKHTPMILPHLGPVFLVQRPRPYLYLGRVSHPFLCFLSALFFRPCLKRDFDSLGCLFRSRVQRVLSLGPLCLVVVVCHPEELHFSFILSNRRTRPKDDTYQHRHKEGISLSTWRTSVQRSASCVR